MAEGKRHPNDQDLYTPITPELLDLLERMRVEFGSWRLVAARSETRLKVIRNLRNTNRKAISQTLLDRLCTTTGIGSVHEFTWFTADDLVTMGIWEPIRYFGDPSFAEKSKPKKRKRRRV